jgi:Tol biopolymer transport system component
MQIYHMERDGKTPTQLTAEPVNVLDYDVSLVDGALAYEIDNQLILINADGSNRRILVDGTPRLSPRGYYRPVFSPDGKTLAYTRGGINIYDLSTGVSNLTLADKPGSSEGALPLETYWTEKYSPDGTKLLVGAAHPPDSPANAVIYSLANNAVVQLSGGGSLNCCDFYGGAEWSADSSSFYSVASLYDFSAPHGALWKVDAASGAVTTLIPAGAGAGDSALMYLPFTPYFASNGQLYFFSAKYPETAGYTRRVPFLIIRSTPDDITTNWTVMRPDTFEMMNEALWSPDADFVIVTIASTKDDYDGGQAELVYLDGRPNVMLTAFAQNMKWGQ